MKDRACRVDFSRKDRKEFSQSTQKEIFIIDVVP